MPNGHDYSKEYGPHDYGKHEGTSDCKYNCGCWMGPARSGGPIGLDPFGECPNNPKDGKQLGTADHEVVVTRRILALETRAYRAEQELEKLKGIKNTPKAKLAEQVESLKGKLQEKENILQEIKNKVNRVGL